MSLLLLVVSALHILILVLLFVATLDKVSFQLTGNPSYSPSLRPHLPASASPSSLPLCLLLPIPSLPYSYFCMYPFPWPSPCIWPSGAIPTLPDIFCLASHLPLPGLCPFQSWWTLPDKESLNLWYDCTWNTTTQTWACSNVSENGEHMAEGRERPARARVGSLD